MAEQIDIISQNTQSTVIAEFERQDKERTLSDHFVIKKNRPQRFLTKPYKAIYTNGDGARL